MSKKLLQVSVDTLLGINWMGASRLVSVMEQTAFRGPFDKFTWKKFTNRADLIASTNGFRPIQVSRILLYMYMANHKDDLFLCKLHSLIDDKFVTNSDIGTFCGIVQGFKRLNYPESKFKEILDLYKHRLLTIDVDNYFQYSLLLNAYTYPEYGDIILESINKHYKKISELSIRELSIITNCVTRISQNKADLTKFVPVLFEHVLNNSSSTDYRSAISLLNSISRFPKFSKIQYINALSDIIIENTNQINLQQITMILRSLRRLKYSPLELLNAIVPRLELMISDAGPLQLSSIITSIKSLNIINQNLMDLIKNAVLNGLYTYNLSHLSQITFSIFYNFDFDKPDFDFDVLARLISQLIRENINKLNIHDIVLFCLSLNKYWLISEFSDLEENLLKHANITLLDSPQISESDRAFIDQLNNKYNN